MNQVVYAVNSALALVHFVYKLTALHFHPMQHLLIAAFLKMGTDFTFAYSDNSIIADMFSPR